jgi:signal transduction histidine kinase
LAISHCMCELRALPEAAAKSLEDAASLITQAQNELRTLSYLLHPPLLDELGLSKALEDYICGFAGRSGLEISLSVDPMLMDVHFEPRVEIALFRVGQEALGNAWRHARCTKVHVGLTRMEHGTLPEQAALIVRDNGCGLPSRSALDRDDHAKCAPGGVGIAGMRERMNQIGGLLVLKEGPRAGLEVQAIFSLMQPD